MVPFLVFFTALPSPLEVQAYSTLLVFLHMEPSVSGLDVSEAESIVLCLGSTSSIFKRHGLTSLPFLLWTQPSFPAPFESWYYLYLHSGLYFVLSQGAHGAGWSVLDGEVEVGHLRERYVQGLVYHLLEDVVVHTFPHPRDISYHMHENEDLPPVLLIHHLLYLI